MTLGHIAKSQSPHGNIESAPREFSVYVSETFSVMIRDMSCVLVTVIVHNKTDQLQLISLALALLQGMTTTAEEGTHLGRLVYDRDGAAFQTFDLSVSVI